MQGCKPFAISCISITIAGEQLRHFLELISTGKLSKSLSKIVLRGMKLLQEHKQIFNAELIRTTIQPFDVLSYHILVCLKSNLNKQFGYRMFIKAILSLFRSKFIEYFSCSLRKGSVEGRARFFTRQY